MDFKNLLSKLHLKELMFSIIGDTTEGFLLMSNSGADGGVVQGLQTCMVALLSR